MVKEQIQLNELQQDALKEVCNLGAAKATTRLSAYVGKKIKLEVPFIKFLEIGQISQLLVRPRKLVFSNFVETKGELLGSMFVLFDRDAALNLLDLVSKRESGSTKKLKQQDIDVLIELSNIINNSYLSTFANFFQIKIIPSEPELILDAEYLLTKISTDREKEHLEYSIIVGNRFTLEDKKAIDGNFFFLLKANTAKKLSTLLDKKIASKKGKIY